MILRSRAAQEMSNIVLGDPDTVLKFVRDYGSHFVQSITVGDVVYQVFALNPDQYEAAKRSMVGRPRISSDEFQAFHTEHLAPWMVRETGTTLVASGDRSTLAFLDAELKDEGRFGSYSNIFRYDRPIIGT